MRKIPVFIAFISLFNPAFCQTPGMEETIHYINAKFKKAIIIEVVKGDLVAKYFTDDPKNETRVDKVSLSDLDFETIGYDTSEKLFYISCFNKDKCVFRKNYKLKESKEYSRISFIVSNDPAQIESLKKAFTHLIKISEERNYEGNVKFQ